MSQVENAGKHVTHRKRRKSLKRRRSLQKAYFFVNILLFYWPTFQPLKCLLPGEIRLERSTLEAAILDLSWQPGDVYVTSFGPTRNWRQGEKPAIDLASFTKVSKSLFFPKRFSILLPLNAIISEFRTCLAQNNTCMAQEQPWPRVAVKSLFGSHLSKGITSRKRGLAAEYCSKHLALTMFEFWASVETKPAL